MTNSYHLFHEGFIIPAVLVPFVRRNLSQSIIEDTGTVTEQTVEPSGSIPVAWKILAVAIRIKLKMSITPPVR